MKTVKRVLWRERSRQVPVQFSWVDQRLVRDRYLDRCDAPSAALYLFLVTVADAQGLSYYGESTLASRLHLSPAELSAARQRLIELQLVAYQAPIYQVLALSDAGAATQPRAGAPTPECERATARARLAQLLDEMERRRARL